MESEDDTSDNDAGIDKDKSASDADGNLKLNYSNKEIDKEELENKDIFNI